MQASKLCSYPNCKIVLQLGSIATKGVGEAEFTAVAPLVTAVNVGAPGLAKRIACVSEVFKNDAGASVRQGSAMWLANASDSVEVVLPGKGRLIASVVASVRQGVIRL